MKTHGEGLKVGFYFVVKIGGSWINMRNFEVEKYMVDHTIRQIWVQWTQFWSASDIFVM